MRIFFLVCLLIIFNFSGLRSQVALRYDESVSVTYEQAVEAYRALAEKYENAELFTEGLTDVGRPLHLFVISEDKDFDPVSLHKKGKVVVLINNGIHPGEPCGIDASIKFVRRVLSEKAYRPLLGKVVLAVIPVYNIGGTLNRNEYWRPQQPGPEESGFRGNARNLDLNRDFAKQDTRNARSFAEIFHKWNPDIFLDTHTTNGSDHKHVITLISTNKDRFSLPQLGDFVKNTFEKGLYDKMAETEYDMIPYISWMHEDPQDGVIEYFTSASFSTGYTALFNTISFMTENHVYKPFKDRVLSVYEFELALLKTAYENAERIKNLRSKANRSAEKMQNFIIERELDTTRFDVFTYTGYKYLPTKSPFTGLERKAYNHDSVFTVDIPFYRYYKAKTSVKKPELYIIPQAWREAIGVLKRSGTKMYRLVEDYATEAEVYYIVNNKKAARQYNGHISNTSFDLRSETQTIQYYKGDYVVPLNQSRNTFIMEMLEPKASSSLFRWNFFDPILERREYMIPNGFEKVAPQVLERNPELKKAWELKKAEDSEFAENHYLQLWYIYSRSPYDEKSYLRYPVGRITDVADLPLTE